MFSNENVTKYFFWLYFAWNKTFTKFPIFDQNHGLAPLQKCQFCAFLKPMFLLFRKACFLYKTSKIVFSRFIFTIYDMRIQVVTWGYRWLQGVTRGYKGWQGVTRGYSGLQRIIETFFLLERSQILFFRLFCIKIKVEEISNFWSKRWTNTFGKILILRSSYTVFL